MAKHIGTELITTKRLILRRVIQEDALPMFQNWTSDPEVTKYLTWPAHKDLQVTNTVINQWLQSYSMPDFYQWMIVPKDANTPVGSISVVRYDSESDTAEIGYCIGKKWWNMGITTEALQAVIHYLFDRVGISHIEAKHDTNTPASGVVMQKCDMTLQEITPKTGCNNQGICDIATYTISNQSVPGRRVHAVVDSLKDDCIDTNIVYLVKATLEDASNIQHMQRIAFAEILEKYQDHETNPANESLERIQWKISHPNSYYYYVMVGENPVGCIRIEDQKDGTPKRISPLFILPQYRSRGYAQAAMQEAEKLHGNDHWTLETILQEKGNCHLYEKMGYQQVDAPKPINDQMSLICYVKENNKNIQ